MTSHHSRLSCVAAADGHFENYLNTEWAAVFHHWNVWTVGKKQRKVWFIIRKYVKIGTGRLLNTVQPMLSGCIWREGWSRGIWMVVHMPRLQPSCHYGQTVVQYHSGLLHGKGVTNTPAVLSQDDLLQCTLVPLLSSDRGLPVSMFGDRSSTSRPSMSDYIGTVTSHGGREHTRQLGWPGLKLDDRTCRRLIAHPIDMTDVTILAVNSMIELK